MAQQCRGSTRHYVMGDDIDTDSECEKSDDALLEQDVTKIKQ